MLEGLCAVGEAVGNEVGAEVGRVGYIDGEHEGWTVGLKEGTTVGPDVVGLKEGPDVGVG